MTTTHPSIVVRGVLAALLGSCCLGAQKGDAAPKEPTPEEIGRAALQRWNELELRPARLPVRGGSVSLRFELTGERGDVRGVATYTWRRGRPGESKLSWEPASLGARLAREGWGREDLDRQFVAEDPFAEMDGEGGGGAVRGERVDDGTIVQLDGHPAGIRRVELDAAGLPRRIDFEVENGTMRFSVEPSYEKRASGYVLREQSFSMDMGFGKIRSLATYSYREVDGLLVPDRVVEKSTFNGQPSETRIVVFADWKLERAPGRAEAEEAAPDEAGHLPPRRPKAGKGGARHDRP